MSILCAMITGMEGLSSPELDISLMVTTAGDKLQKQKMVLSSHLFLSTITATKDLLIFEHRDCIKKSTSPFSMSSIQ